MKALIAMSGGVDSSVAAYQMLQLGYCCAGSTMRLCDEELLNTPLTDSWEDARRIAENLGIPFFVMSCQAAFRQCVVEPFIDCYENGGTPNPCVYCNKKLKFGLFLEEALQKGYDCIATGHYAEIKKDPTTGRHLLYRAADGSKDQTYFLYSLTQHQLAHTCFPLGALTKEQVRTIAAEQNFLNAQKKDSQDICFIPDGDYVTFMKRYTGKTYPVGNYLDKDGNVLGQHSGAVSYTIGQRKGLGIALGAPAYVCAKDMDANTVTLDTDEAVLFHTTLLANDWNWIPFPTLTEPLRVTAKVRYRHKEQPATVYPEDNGFARVVFDTPQRAITTGQAVVLYDGDLVIGGGTICEVL